MSEGGFQGNRRARWGAKNYFECSRGHDFACVNIRASEKLFEASDSGLAEPLVFGDDEAPGKTSKRATFVRYHCADAPRVRGQVENAMSDYGFAWTEKSVERDIGIPWDGIKAAPAIVGHIDDHTIFALGNTASAARDPKSDIV